MSVKHTEPSVSNKTIYMGRPCKVTVQLQTDQVSTGRSLKAICSAEYEKFAELDFTILVHV